MERGHSTALWLSYLLLSLWKKRTQSCALISRGRLFISQLRSLYDRHLKSQPPRSSYFRYRLETLVGITGAQMSKYRQTWTSSIVAPLQIVWRPHLLLILLFEAMVFGFSIGINVSRVHFARRRCFELMALTAHRQPMRYSLECQNLKGTVSAKMPFQAAMVHQLYALLLHFP